MKNENNHLGELYDLAAAQCEGELTAEQATRLEELVLADAKLRSRYVLYMQVHALAEREAVADESGEEQTSKANQTSRIASARTHHARRHTFGIWLAATATALVLVAVVSWGIWPWIFPTESVANIQKGGVGQRGEPQTTPVVVAAADIAVGQRITPEDIEIRQCPVDFVPADAITTVEEATGTDNRPLWASCRLLPGDFLRRAKVTNNQGLQVRPGYRAYTIRCSKSASKLNGFFLPGDFADVLFARRESPKAETLAYAARILAVAQYLDSPTESSTDTGQSVILEVTPDQAEVLAMAQSTGELTLALRNPDEPINHWQSPPMHPPQVESMLEPKGPKGPVEPTWDTEKPDAAQSAEPPGPEKPSREVRILTYRGRKRGQLVIELRIQ